MPVGSNNDALGAAAAGRARTCLAQSIADFFAADEARLDEELRLAIGTRLAELVGSVETALRRHAARLLAAEGESIAAEALVSGETALARLGAAGLLRDPELMGEIIAQTGAERMVRRMPPIDGVEAGLLVRLLDGDDPLVGAAARALLAVGGRRPAARSDLPAEVQHRLVWWVAAAVRPVDAVPAIDRALVEAARRWLAAADEGERDIALAARLASAIDPLPAELPPLLLAALADARLLLVASLLARAVASDAATVRGWLLEPADATLWWALRAAGLGRDDIARVALALATADPRRDLDRIADHLDAVAAAGTDVARARLAPALLPADYRGAVEALAEGAR